VHDLHRAHYRRGSAWAQDVFTGRIQSNHRISIWKSFNAQCLAVQAEVKKFHVASFCMTAIQAIGLLLLG
jgi:hypothetical protein